MIVGDALQQARRRLEVVSESAALDSQVLLAHIMGQTKAWILAHPEALLTSGQEQNLESSLSSLEAGEPLPYVLGHWEFYGVSLRVTTAVLIPRPETELLVETALAWLSKNPKRRRAADIGTGSGCIAVALAKHLPDLKVTATDISSEALQVARANAEEHGVSERIEFIEGDLLAPLNEPVDVLCANLPYIPTSTLHELAVYRHEPAVALDGGPDGLQFIRRLLEDAPRVLTGSGLILLEIEASQGGAVIEIARAAFPAAKVEVRQDLAGHARMVSLTPSPSPI